MATTHKMIKQGIVVSDKNDKTIVVRVERQFIHPLYKKTVRRHKKFMAHDENNSAHEGDIVQIMESRPLSARKRWTLHKIVERSK
ncbi:MAG: 30S ribosomal protein S17 [Candidatus Cloacimonadota bacterium]|uniref:Small ribosomal subunit protein uS17 n=1 Tax=Cloacimonas acidaminovorans (strain Evry) TaxID=459349 RepID=B0VI22_CLOAI|nr:30S ribosomal protein S17 [Candidatus Cloacimonas acidaminovorans]MDD5407319.1 30S ribosomal protein S17 [Candidatus Cloacimonas acidaminovorans]MDI9571943.1 30S ribosomal protein S17 [Candidatus Cloacimonadota bacterium]NLM89751.1 30S ribosomal protein S17 [Candidatus Cloacimonadota bacterium]CAO80993.1 30S ribosomal subunit protein S17 [Candidatus Cloacimonas acidaminovorans str. Evry]